MRALILPVVFVAACGEEPKAIKFKTDLGAVVHSRDDYEWQFSKEDVDAVFRATTQERLGRVQSIKDKDGHVAEGVLVELEDLQAYGMPDVYFTHDMTEQCGEYNHDYFEHASYTVDEHGCYVRGSVNRRPKIVAEFLSADDIGNADYDYCIAVRTRVSHLVAHYVQEALGYDVDHAVPIFSYDDEGKLVRFDESLDHKTQRWLYHWQCAGMKE